MTGELTLRGDVLPVGGIKEKVLAALRAGNPPHRPARDQQTGLRGAAAEGPQAAEVHYVTTADEVLELVLVKDK